MSPLCFNFWGETKKSTMVSFLRSKYHSVKKTAKISYLKFRSPNVKWDFLSNFLTTVNFLNLNLPLFLCTTFAKSSAGSRPFSSPAQRITPLADWKNSKPARKWRKLTNFSSSCCEEKQEGFEKVPTKIDFLTLYACVVFLLFSRLSLILSNYRNWCGRA